MGLDEVEGMIHSVYTDTTLYEIFRQRIRARPIINIGETYFHSLSLSFKTHMYEFRQIMQDDLCMMERALAALAPRGPRMAGTN